MKKKLLIGFMTTAMSYTHLVHADFTFYLNNISDCSSIPGYWTGGGKATNWLIGECSYNGSGYISDLDSNGRFTIEASADKSSGSFLCPKHASEKLSGICANGVTTLITQYGNISGNFSGNSGSASGTLKVAPAMSADVILHFSRS